VEDQTPLLLAALASVMVGVVLPLSPLSTLLGYAPLPVGFFLALVGMVVAYLILIELAERLFFADPEGRLPELRRRGREHQLQRRAARFSLGSPQPPTLVPTGPAPRTTDERPADASQAVDCSRARAGLPIARDSDPWSSTMSWRLPSPVGSPTSSTH
jgi:hypothetical protein